METTGKEIHQQRRLISERNYCSIDSDQIPARTLLQDSSADKGSIVYERIFLTKECMCRRA